MTISLRVVGDHTASNAPVDALNPSTGAGCQAGDISVLRVHAKHSDPGVATCDTPAGWTFLASATTGATQSAGVDSGDVTTFAFYRIGAPASTAVGTLSLGNANSAGAGIVTYQGTAGGWDVTKLTTGADLTHGANISITGAAGIDVAAGDWVLGMAGTNGNAGTPSSIAVGGMSGATLGTQELRYNQSISTSLDSTSVWQDAPVSSGSSSSAPTLTWTNSSSAQASAVLLRLRETSSGVTGTAASTLPALTQAASGAVTAPTFSGTAASALPSLTQAAEGSTAPPAFTGSAASTLPALTQAASGATDVPHVTGTAGSALPPLAQAAAGSVTSPSVTGTASSTLPALSQTATGASTPPAFTGAITGTLPMLTQAASGAVTSAGIVGTIAATLPALTQAASGTTSPPSLTPIYRAAGGTTQVAATDGQINWSQDTPGGPHPARTNLTGGGTYAGTQTSLDGTVPGYVPSGIWTTELYGSYMRYAFAVDTDKTVVVRLYLNEAYHTSAGQRIFDIAINGTVVANDVDLYAAHGRGVGTMYEFIAVGVAGAVTVELTASVDNAAHRGLEVLEPQSLAASGTAASTLPALTQAASGTHTPPAFTGTAASTIPALSQTATGTTGTPAYAGAITTVLPSLTQASTGTFAIPGRTGTITAALPALTQAATGTIANLHALAPASRTLTVAATVHATAITAHAHATTIPATTHVTEVPA